MLKLEIYQFIEDNNVEIGETKCEDVNGKKLK